MDHQTPSYRTFGYFINEILQDKIENIFNDINHAIFNDEHVDLQHLYIDGSKFEANANKYTWVWKKATEKFRYKLYEKITAEIEEINAEIAWSGVQITTNPEYVPDYLNEIVEQLVLLWELDTSTFVYGSGKRKSKEQRHYEHLTTFCQKLQEYIQKIEICGPNRNSYSKTDNSATFNRCPGEKELRLRRLARSASGLFWEYQADKRDCALCPLRDKCLREDDKRGARKVSVSYFAADRQRNLERRYSPEYRDALKLRQVWCEGSFSAQKREHNLARILRRGLEAAEDHCLLSATALNLKRMIKHAG